MRKTPFLALFASAAASTVIVAFAACGGSTTGSSGDNPRVLSDAGSDAPPQIAQPATCSPETQCADACVDTASDQKNCGNCGVSCKDTQRCAASKCVDVGAFAFDAIFLGDTDRSFADSTTAWQLYGENVDGLVSTAASTDTCKLAPGAVTSTADDGPNGLDNSFGKNIVPVFVTTAGTGFSNNISVQIEAGKFTEIFGIDAYIASQDLPLLSTSFLHGAPFTGIPTFNGTDAWPITADSVNASGSPLVVFAQSSIKAGVFDSGPAGSVAGSIEMPFQGVTLPLTIHKMHVTMTIGADGSKDGNISGVLDTEEFIAAFQAVAGNISTSLCSGSAFDSIAAQLRQASDIMNDGTQDPNQPCNGISVGIGFNAAPVLLGAVAAPVVPPPNPCP